MKVHTVLPSVEGLRQLIDSSRWSIKIVWSMQAPNVLGLGLVTLARGLFPAGMALVIRALINTVTEIKDSQAEVLGLLLPWLVLGLVLTVVEAVSNLYYRFLMQRFSDDIDLNITSKILDHAARLDVAFFEDPHFQDIINRAQQNTAGRFSRFFTETLTFTMHLIQIVSLVAVLISIEPLVIVVLAPFAFFHLLFQWRLSKRHYLEEYTRATKRRWTQYFVSLLTNRRSVPEIKLLDLAPLLINRFCSLMTEFRNQNRSRYLSSLKSSSAIAFLTSFAVFGLLANVLRRFLAGTVTIGDVAVFGTVGLRLRTSLEAAVLSCTSALGEALYIY